MKASGFLQVCGIVAGAALLLGGMLALEKTERADPDYTTFEPLAVPGTAAAPERTQPPTATVPDYVLRSWNGGLGLFLGDAETPYRVVAAELSVLPDGDRAALAAGIHAPSEEPLRQMIEDYAS